MKRSNLQKNLNIPLKKLLQLIKIYIYIFLLAKKEDFILLVLLFKGVSLRPELSSLPRFRIQGGPLSVTDGGEGWLEILVSNIGLEIPTKTHISILVQPIATISALAVSLKRCIEIQWVLFG